jgi:hypothetical protein
MEKKTNTKNARGHGGARAGAGRPKGTTTTVSIASLLGAIDNHAGRPYIELLAEDFVHARGNDKNLAQKYHNLILNKVAATLTQVETVDSADSIEAKAEAFAEALALIAGKKS